MPQPSIESSRDQSPSLACRQPDHLGCVLCRRLNPVSEVVEEPSSAAPTPRPSQSLPGMISVPHHTPGVAVQPVVSVPALEPVKKGALVQLAETYEATIRKLKQEHSLLVAAECRVESLQKSITERVKAAEIARGALAEFITTDLMFSKESV